MSENENKNENGGQGNFGLPESYFQRSAASIMNRVEWEDEHKEYPVLKSLKGRHGFDLPRQYFNKTETRLELLEFEKLGRVLKTNAFSVPAGYFESAEVKEFLHVFVYDSAELNEFSKLKSVPKKVPFTTPEDYFTSNEKLLYSLLEFRRETKIVDLFFSRGSYVAAAMLAIAIGLWAYSTWFNPAEQPDCSTIACVDRSEVLNSSNIESMDDEDLMELVNPVELEKALQQGTNSNQKIAPDTGAASNDELMEEI